MPFEDVAIRLSQNAHALNALTDSDTVAMISEQGNVSFILLLLFVCIKWRNFVEASDKIELDINNELQKFSSVKVITTSL